MEALPQHLQKYIVKQNYQKYTPVDHAVWRYVLRQLRNFLRTHAHESYLDGLEKTGIEIEQIPSIESISSKLQKFGWRALPVSGFIPPAAFMELQSLGILPIASDMRSLDHLLYTPAPDIVHEAAGHAPILVHPEYADYLRQYAQVAKKAILSRQDLEQYEAIRLLSDIKENPASTAEEIKAAEQRLAKVSAEMKDVSEAAELGRMNWWTAEYGLIGDVNNFKLFGAGLLSSVGESKLCISNKVKKIPLTVECIKQGYDITEPQPQLFVAKDFKNLVDVLQQMAEGMAFKLGGTKGLDKAIKAESVNTVQLNSEIQIGGVLTKYILDDQGDVAYLQFEGPTQLAYHDKEIVGHDKAYHKDGYGTPIGLLADTDFSQLSEGQNYSLTYRSGVKVDGFLQNILKRDGKPLILTFKDATATFKGQTLFKPEWGLYDIVVGETVTSVFGGPADRVAYGETVDFVAAKVATPVYTEAQKKLFSLYQDIRDLRATTGDVQLIFDAVFAKINREAPEQWLLYIELLEFCNARNLSPSSKQAVTKQLENLKSTHKEWVEIIEDGINLSHETY